MRLILVDIPAFEQRDQRDIERLEPSHNVVAIEVGEVLQIGHHVFRDVAGIVGQINGLAVILETGVCCVIGNLGKDAETKTLPNNTTVVTFSVAVNKKWTDEKKVDHKRTDWHDVEVWGPRMKSAGTLKKGTPVQVEGEVKTGSYKDKDGVEHKTWVIKANSLYKIDYSQAGAEEEISDANEDA